jgi:DNA-binding MurR/RpiR family transcriptional regulator
MSSQFTKTDWKIYKFIKNNLKKFSSLTASVIAKEIDISDASIIRFSQKVGFSGFYELRYMIQKELEPNISEHPNILSSSLFNDNKTLLERLYSQINPIDIVCLKNSMLESQHLFILAIQSNQHLISIIAQKFLSIGILLQTITTFEALEIHTNLTTQKDLCIVIDASNQSTKINKKLKQLKSNHVYMVAITDAPYENKTFSWDQEFVLPKKTDLKSNYSISNEITILTLFDILFDNFLDNKKFIKMLDRNLLSSF